MIEFQLLQSYKKLVYVRMKKSLRESTISNFSDNEKQKIQQKNCDQRLKKYEK